MAVGEGGPWAPSPVPSQSHARPASPDAALGPVSLEQPVEVSAAVSTGRTDRAPRCVPTAVGAAHAWGRVRSHRRQAELSPTLGTRESLSCSSAVAARRRGSCVWGWVYSEDDFLRVRHTASSSRSLPMQRRWFPPVRRPRSPTLLLCTSGCACAARGIGDLRASALALPPPPPPVSVCLSPVPPRPASPCRAPGGSVTAA